MRPTALRETATGSLITERSQVRLLSPLLKKVALTRPNGRVSWRPVWLVNVVSERRAEPSRVSCTLGALCARRMVRRVLGIVVGFGLGGWDTAEAVHETALVVPSDV